MRIPWISIAALFGAAGVVMGAMGAHSLAGNEAAKGFHDTALMYQMFHVFALMAVAGLTRDNGRGNAVGNLAGLLFCLGIFLFSGSLYVLAQTGNPVGGFITPMGGMCLILGWLLLAVAGFQDWRQKKVS